MPALLNAAGPVPAKHAEDGETIVPGHIYVAPPDRHMIVADGQLRLLRGPKENCARPAIDPLFRSVAESYGSHAVGVILDRAYKLRDLVEQDWLTPETSRQPAVAHEDPDQTRFLG